MSPKSAKRRSLWRGAIPVVVGTVITWVGAPNLFAQTGHAKCITQPYGSAPYWRSHAGTDLPPAAPSWQPHQPSQDPSAPQVWPSPVPPSPATPATPGTPSPMMPAPAAPPAAPPVGDLGQPTPSPAQDFAQPQAPASTAPLSSSLAASSVDAPFAPNMIGDFFGTGGSTLTFPGSTSTSTSPGATQTQTILVPQSQITPVTQNVGGTIIFQNSPTFNVPFSASSSPGGTVVLTYTNSSSFSDPLTVFNNQNVTLPDSLGFLGTDPAPLSGPLPPSFGLQEEADVTNAIQAAFPNATSIVYQNGTATDTDPTGAMGSSGSVYNVGVNYLVTENQTTTILVPTVVSVPDSSGGVSQVTVLRPVTIVIPSPSSSGAVVGRQKIAENTSPIPRDRVFMNYSYFNNTQLAANGVDVNRFTPGFEKTFFDGNSSIEFRFPFASTLDSNILADGSTNTNELEFGNISVALKTLLYSTRTFGFSAGLAVTVPTGDDVTVGLANGTQLLEVENESVHLLPFTGFLWAPDRLFVQGYVQADFDTNGNSVHVANGAGGLRQAGVANDQTFLFADLGMGYWLYQNEQSQGIRGIAPILEMHYNRSLQESDVVRSGSFAVGSAQEDIEVLNGVIGATMKIGEDKFLTTAYATPIGNSADQQFDGELRVILNWYFGGSVGSPLSYGSVLP